MASPENLISLLDAPVAVPEYPTFKFQVDEDGERLRDAGLRFMPDVRENLLFRAKQRELSEGNPEFQQLQVDFCRNSILYFVNVWCWTFDPRLSMPHIPFVTYPFQDDVLTWNLWLIKAQETGLVEKSRDQGLTWMEEAVSAYMTLFFPGMVDYQMSLREDDVDNRMEDSLLGKYRYLVGNLPMWMRGGWVEKEQGTDQKMQIRIPQTGSAVRGQLTMGTSGRSGRGTRVFNDEFAFVEDADKVLKALASLAPAGLYGSTPNGAGNAFYVMAHRPDVKKKTLHWSLHPMKNPEWAAKERGKITYTDESWAQEHEISYEMSTMGRVYPEFKSFTSSEFEWCHIQEGEYYEYDPHYDVVVKLDFGMADPTSALFGQIKPPPLHFESVCSELLVIFDEEEAGNRTVDDWADVFMDRGYHYREFIGDYRSGNQRDPTGQTWISYLAKKGIDVKGRYNTEQAPIMEVKRLLQGGVKGMECAVPMLALNRKSVPNAIKSFQNWSYPTEKAEDGSTRIKPGSKPKHDQWSHSMKAMAYGTDWLYGQTYRAGSGSTDWDFRVFGKVANL